MWMCTYIHTCSQSHKQQKKEKDLKRTGSVSSQEGGKGELFLCMDVALYTI